MGMYGPINIQEDFLIDLWKTDAYYITISCIVRIHIKF